MKYCNTCGELTTDRDKYCIKCGASTAEAETKEQYSEKYNYKYIAPQNEPSPNQKMMDKPAYDRTISQKSVLLLILLMLCPGIGLIYAGKKRKGTIMFAIYVVVVATYTVFSIGQILPLILFFGACFLAMLVWGVNATIKEIKIINANKIRYKQMQYSMERSDYTVYK
ncbi:MAG: hypothetical protein ACXAAM_08670 [Candidatus Heimdallarchaeaceae archaeon]|jgi:CHASE2 domain-containing sensor protein